MTGPAPKKPPTAREMMDTAKPSPGGRRATAQKRAATKPANTDEAAAEAASDPKVADVKEFAAVGDLIKRPTTDEEWRELFKDAPGALWVGEPGPTEAMTIEQWEQLQPPSVHELWCRVMETVRLVEKADYNKDQKFRFRGIDSVMEAVGPALRAHHIHIRPRRIMEHSATEYSSKHGARMVNRLVRIEWEVTGPQGDSFIGESMGEAADSSDKSMTKAQSVAYRVFLLNALTIPTGDPDPDAETHERATPSEREQAVQQASARAYSSREEFERERASQAQQAPSQDERRQDQAGEENQAEVGDNEEARKELWRVAKGLGWNWNSLAARFKSDHDGRETKASTTKEIEAFTQVILDEATAEEDRAKAAAAQVLGAKEVEPDSPPASLL